MTMAKVKSITQGLLRSIFTMFRSVSHLLGSMLSILAESAETTSDDATSNAVRGGVLNYRTDKLDDGTDPYGWYDHE